MTAKGKTLSAKEEKAAIDAAWQELNDLTDEQMACEHDYWETPSHWGDKCTRCGLAEDLDPDMEEDGRYAYFHDGFRAGLRFGQ